MGTESGNQDAERMEREVADVVRQEQQRGANLEGYPEVPALVEQDEPTAEELEGRAQASLHPLPAPEEPPQQDWPPHIETQVEQGRISSGHADWMARKEASSPPEERPEHPPLDQAA